MHSLLSPSSAERWLNCTPSAQLENLYENKKSEHAEEGSLAHKWAENELKFALGVRDLKEYYEVKTGLKEHKYYAPKMLEYIDIYTNEVLRTLTVLQKPQIEIEKSVIIPLIHGIGTADCVIRSGKTLVILDFKYGQGVEVSADDNPQLKLYSLAMLNKDTNVVITGIIQPRLNNISYCEYTAEYLKAWAADIMPLISKALKGEGEFKTGSWCRWCKHKVNCTKHFNETMSILETPKELTTEQIAQLLDKKPIIEDYLKSIEKYALEKVRDSGEWIPGYKLVLSRTIRKYKDPKAVTEALLGAGLGNVAFKPQEPLSIGQMEKALGKARFNEILGDLVVKPEGEPVLVPDTDKREEFVNISVEEAFKDIGE